MSEIGVYTGVAIAILSVAYPIISQVISTLDDKYASVHVVELFDNEFVKNAFKNTLISSLVFLAIWSFKFTAPDVGEDLQWHADNSAAILLIISTILLVVLFFLFVDKMFMYLIPSRFFRYLIRRHRKDKSQEKKFFLALTDVFLNSIQKQNHQLSLAIAQEISNDFRKIREENNNLPVEYPYVYYSLVYKTIEELTVIREKRNVRLEYDTAGGSWLLGGMGGYEISDTTYQWLWHNIRLAVQHERDDLVMYHCEHAHQYMSLALNYIQPELDRQTFVPRNAQAIEKRNQEREKFFHFHLVLGALLLYRKRYALIKRMFDYTTSTPPRYELLPSTMYQIFNVYLKHRDIYSTIWISHKYPFPDMEGVDSDAKIGKWISAYLALLFLRQYTLSTYLAITIDPLAFPDPPKLQGEKRILINGLDWFRKRVDDHLNNKELLNIIKLKFITPTWCETNGKVHPLDFIDQLKARLEQAYDLGAKNLEVSEEKKDMFFAAGKQAVESALNHFTNIKNTGTLKGELTKWVVPGGRMVQDKDAFAEKSEVHNTNFDTFLPYEVSRSVISGISSTFLYARTKTYLLKPEDLFLALDEMGITKRYIIIALGLDLNEYITERKVRGLKQAAYKGIPIIELPSTTVIDPSLFVLKKNDLPSIEILAPAPSEIEQYELKSISDVYAIYASVIDLNKASQQIRDENAQGKTDDELRKSVLMNLLFKVKIAWQQTAKVYQLIEYSEYREQGIPNELATVGKVDQ